MRLCTRIQEPSTSLTASEILDRTRTNAQFTTINLHNARACSLFFSAPSLAAALKARRDDIECTDILCIEGICIMAQ